MQDLLALKNFIASILRPIVFEAVKENLREQKEKNSLKREFYSPKEFSGLTGIPYSTILRYCSNATLKARQIEPGACWQILASELDRLKREANENA